MNLNNKTIVHISNFRANFGGTFIKQITTISNKIIKNGGNVVLIFPEEAKELAWSDELSKKYSIYFVPSPTRSNYYKVWTILKDIFYKENAYIVHSHFDGYDLVSLKAMKKKGKVIWHSHNAIDIEKLVFLKRMYAKTYLYIKYKILSKDKYMIFLDDHFRKEAINRKIVGKERSCIITNAIDFERLKIADGKPLKKQFYLDVEKKLVLAFVRDSYGKGLDLILNSFEKINKSECYLNLALVCEENSKEFLLKRYNGNIPSYILILNSKENVSDYYNMADIFISASRKETFCNAVAEAVYMEKEVISSDIDGLQWAKELPSVVFFENENYEDLYRTILEVIKVKNNNYDKHLQSKKIIESKYTIDSWSNKIIQYYYKII